MEKPLCRSSKGRSFAVQVQITSETVQPSSWAILRSIALPGLPVKARWSNARSNSTAIFAKRSSRSKRYKSSIPRPTRRQRSRGCEKRVLWRCDENENRKPRYFLETHSSDSCLSRGQNDAASPGGVQQLPRGCGLPLRRRDSGPHVRSVGLGAFPGPRQAALAQLQTALLERGQRSFFCRRYLIRRLSG